jgi:hypothetical protein
LVEGDGGCKPDDLVEGDGGREPDDLVDGDGGREGPLSAVEGLAKLLLVAAPKPATRPPAPEDAFDAPTGWTTCSEVVGHAHAHCEGALVKDLRPSRNEPTVVASLAFGTAFAIWLATSPANESATPA